MISQRKTGKRQQKAVKAKNELNILKNELASSIRK
jgi:hypothetical protein